MLKEDETALVCDLAETYRIFDMRGCPAGLIATLACGLKPDSRIKMKLAGVKVSPPNSLLYAFIVDELRALRFTLTGDRRHPPVFIQDVMVKGIPEKELKGFNTPAEFERKRREIIERING